MKSKEAKNRIVPKLRFPEFRDAESWKVMQLSKLGRIFGGLTGKSANDFGLGKPYITYKQIFNNSRVDVIKCEFVTIADNENQNSLQYGDVLFTMSSETPDEIGYASVLLDQIYDPIYLNSFCFAFRPNSLNELRPEFSRYLFHSPIYRKEISVLAQGITRFNISKTLFADLKLPISKDPNEQQKIADCLSSIDELISATGDKIEALKAHKKGLMQQLFPAEGEIVPKLRFHEFRDAKSWEEKTLGDVADFINEKILLQKLTIENYISTENMLSDYQGITRASKLPTSGSYTHFKKGDILISNIRPYLKKVWFSDKEGATSNDIIVIRATSFIINDFLSFLLKNDAFILYIMKGAEGVKMPRGDKYLIRKYSITFPKDKPEQQKIADFLSSLDNLITAQTKKIEQLKAHKKGLMQQLFPNINEYYG